MIAAAIGAIAATAVAAALAAGGGGKVVQTSVRAGVPIQSVHPTGVGLPLVRARGTVGAGDYASALKAYHDSGAYESDLSSVDAAAKKFLRQKLNKRARRERQCKRPGPSPSCPKGKPGIVFDIDETALSSYSRLAASNFTGTVGALAAAIVAADSPALEPTLSLFDWAKKHGVSTFFITGRPGSIPAFRDFTDKNLKAAGYSGWTELHLNDGGEPTKQYKSGTRAAIEKEGYRILVNVGDQESDLVGGYAVRGFKLPNPFYFIGNK